MNAGCIPPSLPSHYHLLANRHRIAFTEVTNLEVAIGIDQEVGGLKVTMQYSS